MEPQDLPPDAAAMHHSLHAKLLELRLNDVLAFRNSKREKGVLTLEHNASMSDALRVSLLIALSMINAYQQRDSRCSITSLCAGWSCMLHFPLCKLGSRVFLMIELASSPALLVYQAITRENRTSESCGVCDPNSTISMFTEHILDHCP